MKRMLTIAASALALSAAGTVLAQDSTYQPPAGDDTTTAEPMTPQDDGTVYDDGSDYEDELYDDTYGEPMGDANDDDGEVIAPSEEQLEEDGAVSPNDPAVLPEDEELGDDEAGEDTMEDYEVEPEL